MLDKKWLQNNIEFYNTSCKKRNITSNYDEFIKLNTVLKQIIKEQEGKKTKQNQIQSLTKESVALKNELISLNTERNKAEKELQEWLSNQPNILLEQVPFGLNENDNQIIFNTSKSDKISKPHYEIIDNKNFVMKNEATKISGSRFIIMKNYLAKLKRLLVEFMLDHNEKFGYQEYVVPYLVNEQCMYGVGQLPKFKEDAFCTTIDKWLISTGEVSLVNMFRDYVFTESELPKLCMAYTPCFRSEAGAAGKDTRGLIRLHQFHKIELVTICTPEQANEMHQKQLDCAKSILDKLELSYQVLLLCGADTGFSATKQYDIEVWMPGMQRYLEIASCSQCSTFQAIRANIRYKNSEGKINYVHTLNGSALPIERLLAAIIENYYDESNNLIATPKILG